MVEIGSLTCGGPDYRGIKEAMMNRLDKIANEHLMTSTSGCICGGMQLGESYPRHVAEVTQKAIAADIWEIEQEVRKILVDRDPTDARLNGASSALQHAREIANDSWTT